MDSSIARERVLNTAERLFMERGYAAVTLRDIAEALGMRQASLYHHVPGGKEQLFIEVLERFFRHHRETVEQIIASAGHDWRTQLDVVALWLVEQPPMDLMRMIQSDLPALDPVDRERLTLMADESLLQPLNRIFLRAFEQGHIWMSGDARTLVGAFQVLIQSTHLVPPQYMTMTRHEMAREMLKIFIDGIRVRGEKDEIS